MRLLATALTMMAAVLAAGCANEPAPALTVEQAYLAEIDATPGLTRSGPDDEMVKIGRGACDVIGTPGVTHDTFVQALGTSKFGPAVAPVILGSAERHLCPGKQYSTAPAVPYVPPTSPVPDAPVTTSQPADMISDGTYEVGPDVQTGKYKTAGPLFSNTCYWERSRTGSGQVSDIIANSAAPGPQIVTVRKGEYFKTAGCAPWTKAS